MTTLIKANGEKQEFSQEKLLRSIQRAGIPHQIQQEVLSHVQSVLHENMHTSELYKHITEFLGKKESGFHQAKYNLKQAIMDLGPTGYPFEDYVATLLTAQGYKTQTRTILLGKCISHEIDVIAIKEDEKTMVEAKFHNSVGVKTDVQVALYTQARFVDVENKEHFTHPMLITNTKITTDVIAYAQCMGMHVMSWDYPEGNSLRDLVTRYNLYPITALSKLPKTFQQQLLEQNIVLCKSVCLNPSAITSLSLSEEEKNHILDEAKFLCTKTG